MQKIPLNKEGFENFRNLTAKHKAMENVETLWKNSWN